MTDIAQPTVTPASPRPRRAGNAVRFPAILNIAISREISDGLARAKENFQGLQYTDSDVARLALFTWLHSQGFIANNEKGPTHA